MRRVWRDVIRLGPNVAGDSIMYKVTTTQLDVDLSEHKQSLQSRVPNCAAQRDGILDDHYCCQGFDHQSWQPENVSRIL